MARKAKAKSPSTKTSSGKLSSAKASQRPRRSGDFGVPASDRRQASEVSDKTKHRGTVENERGDLQPRAGTDSREAGVGGREGGPGSFSGGDTDPDITGVGFGGSGLAEGAAGDRDIGAAETDGSSDQFASGPRARGANQRLRSHTRSRDRSGKTKG